MTCYTVPLSAAILLFAARKASKNTGGSLRLLNQMLAGGSVMLVIDHWWNGELLLLSENLASDLLLGILMTMGTIVFWGALACAGKTGVVMPARNRA